MIRIVASMIIMAVLITVTIRIISVIICISDDNDINTIMIYNNDHGDESNYDERNVRNINIIYYNKKGHNIIKNNNNTNYNVCNPNLRSPKNSRNTTKPTGRFRYAMTRTGYRPFSSTGDTFSMAKIYTERRTKVGKNRRNS